jgi:ribosomal protein S18 acetylase RimI-like enzyme
MKERQVTSQLLWSIYNLSNNQANDLLLKLGFEVLPKMENQTLYMVDGEAFVLTEENGLITQVQYKTLHAANYFACIEHAKTLGFEIVSEELEPVIDILRLDDNECSLICMAVHPKTSYISFGVTLLAKLLLPTSENKVDVILRPPPMPENKNNQGSSW